MAPALPARVPNLAAADPRAVVTGTDTTGPVPVEYRFRPAQGDAQHLIVVFSGFNAPNGYHFAGKSLNDLRANVLWIRDHFDEHYSYYMCRGMSFDIEASVLGFIDRTLAGLGLTRDRTSLLGVSKGGSAALYYGLKHGFRNIVTVVPQFLIGDYVRDHQPVTGRYMTGPAPLRADIDRLNGSITEQLTASRGRGHNIYLFTSQADEQYRTEIGPHLGLFGACDNFNLIRTDSPMVRGHGEVSPYNLPLIRGVLASLGEGAEPRLGFLENGHATFDESGRRRHLAELRGTETLHAVLYRQEIRGDRLHLGGHAFIPGDAGLGAVPTTKHLVVEGRGKSLEFRLAATEAAYTHSLYFDRYACDYPDAGFEPADSAGIPTAGIPRGSYALSVRLGSPVEGIDRVTPLVARGPFDLRRPVGGVEICLTGDDSGVRLIRRPVLGRFSQETAFSLEKTWLKDRQLHVEGVFFVHGLEAAARGHAAYYLVLRGAGATYSYRLGMSRKAAAVRPQVRSGDYGCYDFGYFATSGYQGVDVRNAAPGDYEVLVSMSRGGSLFSAPAGTVTLR